MRLFEWQSKSFGEHKEMLPEFVNYLAGAWQNRNRYVEQQDELSEEEQQERKINKQRFFDFTVDGKISARNYVGVVQYEGIRIEVYPKILMEDESINVKKYQLNVLYWLKYCRKIKFPFSFADVSKLNFDDYLELLIYLFGNYTEEILSQQPYQAYQLTEEETTFLKGRLSFDNYTKKNLITGQWQNFFCAHEPFVYDNLFNRIVKYVAKRLLAISENYLNKEQLNKILFLLHDVSDVSCTAEDCEKVKLNPLYEDHRHIVSLCKLYLSNQVIDMDSEDSKNFCFLIPMEYVFEDFIFGFISDKWPTLNLKSQSTDNLAMCGGIPVFQIRNDIYIKDKLIIDTKYKIRAPGDGRKAGVSQNDMYQVISYSLRRDCNQVLLLYPKTATSIHTPTSFQIPSSMLSQPINVNVASIDITFDDIEKADELIKERVSALSPVFVGVKK